ncbi:MAG TPA: hypothetical protein VI934_04655 [Candidatus Nanoarchaeia archaeon]|nr:hypothetical protein [Candidatus Nanoarchaeia archaeon]
MRKEIVVAERIGDAPRPIYLVGNADYEVKNGQHLLTATAVFPSNVPSIEDRMKKHPIPHVNAGDAFFGVWNGIYLICSEEGFYGTLSNKGSYEAHIPIPADKRITLELAVTITESLNQGRFDVKANFDARYTIGSRELMRLFGEGYAIKG